MRIKFLEIGGFRCLFQFKKAIISDAVSNQAKSIISSFSMIKPSHQKEDLSFLKYHPQKVDRQSAPLKQMYKLLYKNVRFLKCLANDNINRCINLI